MYMFTYIYILCIFSIMILKVKHFWLPLQQFGGLDYSIPSIKLMATAAESSHQESATSLSASFLLPSPHLDSPKVRCVFIHKPVYTIVFSVVKLYKLI